MKYFFGCLVVMIQFGFASIELYCGLSGNSSNPALSLAVSMFCFGMGIMQVGLIASDKD